MRRISLCVAVIVVALALLTPPASAQNPSAWLTPESPEPLEAAGKVVLTVTMWRAGRVTYQTMDGACSVDFFGGGTTPAATCSGSKAGSPADYTATSGELVFTQGGTKTISIPIVNDGVAEGDEAFTLVAWEAANADPWLERGDTAVVRIVDDDGAAGQDSGAPAAGTATTVASSRPASPPQGARVPPITAPIDDPPVAELATKLASPTLQPGPGFELSSGASPKAAPSRAGPDGASGSSWLAPGLVIAAVGVIAAADMRRRKQWSPTRS